jgi:hypothetical protein
MKHLRKIGAFAALIFSASAQDTRIVNEPVFPPPCTVLTAELPAKLSAPDEEMRSLSTGRPLPPARGSATSPVESAQRYRAAAEGSGWPGPENEFRGRNQLISRRT